MRTHLKTLAGQSAKPVVLFGDLNVGHLDADIWNVTAKHIPKSAGLTPKERAAFGTLLAVLASRLRGAAQPPSNACDGVDLPEHLEAQGHPGRPARWLAPGSTFTLLSAVS